MYVVTVFKNGEWRRFGYSDADYAIMRAYQMSKGADRVFVYTLEFFASMANALNLGVVKK